MIKPKPIPVTGRYFYTRCDRCGWHGSSEQCGEMRYCDDADVVCPACHEIMIADDWTPEAAKAAEPQHT
jgi:NAD-dependent SIR2 family protein deacetylase